MHKLITLSLILSSCTLHPASLTLPGVQVFSPFAEEGMTTEQLKQVQAAFRSFDARIKELEAHAPKQ